MAKARKRRSKSDYGYYAAFLEWAEAELTKDIRNAQWPNCFDDSEI